MIMLLIKYGGVGIINTAIHWLLFLLFYYYFHLEQSICNVIAFGIAVTFSYVMNSKFTFDAQYGIKKYLCYSCTMGALAYFIGYCSDYLQFEPIVTLFISSAVSFILGFSFSLLIFKKVQ